ncbi:hypothetical protein MMB17_05760 [Methylobacterium organophilum]|uniref:hypothetical protein n=1 Tax=Methylobacterium organophilum TaxID=410 RepID=UPI001F138FDA|nr:hypothetical protein [Methylobacterium organophilum]UMY18820.1 hypothetical protein MMB17_05760 [Methylobacterium organophilum]
MTKATLTPNGDGTFALSTGRMHLGRVALQPPPAWLAVQRLQGTVTGVEDAADGSWSVKLADVHPVIETAPRAEPAPWVAECLRQFLQAAIDAGEFTPPEGATVEGMVGSLRLCPAGSTTVLDEG